ncbi:Heterokaryon incompatibility protein (HET) domain containing protein [Naviculisporaceae sp. PSN 640]
MLGSLVLAVLVYRLVPGIRGTGTLPNAHPTVPSAPKLSAINQEEHVFTYQPLFPKENIRVVVLYPPSLIPAPTDNNPSDIRCSIKHIRFGDRRYDALSYCWGGTAKCREIMIDSTPVSVTESLYAALVSLRDDVVPICLWADAVCINQADPVEKEHQIPLMRDIYTNAQNVWIWLGESSPDDADNGGLEFAEFLEQASYTDRTPPEKQYVWAFPSEDVPPHTDERWARFFAIFSRPWFSRLWIIQEVVLAKNPIIMCGGARLAWDRFIRAFDYTGLLGIQALAKGLDTIHALKNCRDLHLARTPLLLAKLLVRTQGSKATDPRDKIYGLLGLAEADDPLHRSITPSYETATEDLYRYVTVRSIHASKNLDILQAIHSRDTNNLVLPSWVPDWSRSKPYLPLRYSEIEFPDNANPENQLQQFRATTDSQAVPQFVAADPDQSVLGLRGHAIGVLEDVSLPRNRGTGFNASYGALHALRDMERVAGARSGSTYRFTGESILDCYWQTLCAGIMPGGFRHSQNTFRRFDACVQTIHAFTRPLERAPAWLSSTTWLRVLFVGAAGAFVLLFRSVNMMQDLTDFLGNFGATEDRRVARTDTGYVCLVPQEAVPGDSIVLLKGGKVPFVVRRDRSGPQKENIWSLERWEMVGEAYVHGAMKGEAFKPEECQDFWFS